MKDGTFRAYAMNILVLVSFLCWLWLKPADRVAVWLLFAYAVCLVAYATWLLWRIDRRDERIARLTDQVLKKTPPKDRLPNAIFECQN